jgi:hypothetical protein
MRFGVLIGVVAALAMAQAAHSDESLHGPVAQASSAPPSSGACGGWASATFNDGCAGAPSASAYTIQHPDFFSGYARQSGQTYVTTGGCKGKANCHPPWAVAGVDYPVGVSTVGTGFASPGSATDPTNASSPNYSNGNPGKCAKSSVNLIICNGPTSQEVDIGPFDFSWQGNATGHGMGLTITRGVTGPCVIHDSYFVFDLNATGHSVGVAAYNFQGCSSLTIKNSVFRLRNDTSGVMDAIWAPPGSTNLFIFAAAGPRINLNNPLNLEYNVFIHCPSRCFTTGALNSSHNYFEGVNMYDSTGFAAHGDGWMTAFYNGPVGPRGNYICNCSGLNTLAEKFDTWLVPNMGAGATSCLTCAIVNLPAGSVAGTSEAGSNILHVTAVHMNSAGTYPSVGMPINGVHSYDTYSAPPPPAPFPRIAGCPNNTCDGSPGDYILNVPWTRTCRTNCGWGLIFQASVDTADYENNVWVGNIINSTGAARSGFCTGPGCGAIQSAWWAGYGIYQNVIVKNNYADLCGISGAFRQARDTTGPPDYHCAVPRTTTDRWFGGSAPETSAVEGGNVMMTNGACFSLWKRQNSC